MQINFSLIAGILILFASQTIHGDRREYSFSLKDKFSSSEFLCSVFPKYVKGGCPQGFSAVSSDSKINVQISSDEEILANILQKPKDKKCEICKRLVKYYEFIINKSLTPTFVQSKLLNVCQVYKSPLSDQCVDFYKGKGLEVIKAILNNEDPTKVCQLINLCLKDEENSFHHQFLELLEIFSSQIDSRRCKVCILYFKWLENNINNQKTALDIYNILLGSCEIFNDKIKKGCTDFYTKHGVSFIQNILNKEDPKKICQTIHFCHGKELKVDSPVSQIKSSKISTHSEDKNCEMCKNYVLFAEIVFDKSLTPTFVQSKLLNNCQVFKSPINEKCVTFYKGKGLEVIKAILNNEDPTKVCQLINMCLKNEESGLSHQFLELLKMLSVNQKPDVCDFCMNSVKFTEEVINHQKSALEIRNILMESCQVLNGNFKKGCTEFYNLFGVSLFQSILNNEDPKKICQAIYRCPQKELKIDSPFLKKISANILQKPKDKNCEICKGLVNFYEFIVNRSLTPTFVQSKMFNDCQVYKSPLNEQCVTFYKGKGLEVIKAILNNEVPTKVCQLMNLCLTNEENSFPHQFLELLKMFSVKQKSDQCNFCMAYVKFTEEVINHQKSALEIRNILMDSCQLLKDAFKKDCTEFYKLFGVSLFQSILNNEDPKKICQAIYMCPQKELKIDSPFLKKILANILQKPKDKKCEICKRLVKYYEFIINKSLTPTFVQNKVLNVCQVYKSPISDQCVAFYKGKGFEIIKAILNNEDPTKVCQLINLCLKDEENTFPYQFLELLDIFSEKKDSRRCKVCIFYIKWWENNINNHKSASDIHNILLDSCEILNDKTKKACTDFYTKYGVSLIQSILNKEDPKKICQTIHFCHGKELKVDSPVLQKPLQNPIECYLCKEIMKELVKMLKKNSTENEIRKALLKVCKALPRRWRHKCDDFINKYTNKIVELILKNIALNKICAILKLCSDMVISDEILYYLPQTKYSKPKGILWKDIRRFDI